MIMRSPQNSFGGEGRRIGAKKFVAGIAGLVVLFYATVVLACSCIHDDFLDSVNAQNALRGSLTATETADQESGERVCQSVHEHILLSSVLSNHPARVAEFPYTGVLAHEAVALQRGTLEGFRPPGLTFAFQFHSILRI